MQDQKNPVILCASEKRLLEYIRRFKEGELRIIVAKGLPVEIQEIRRNIQL